MILDPEAYNTQREKLSFSEYGRNVQKMVEHVVKIEDSVKRNQLAKTIVAIMANLNPGIKEYGDFQHKLWDQLFIMSDFKLDVESPYPVPTREVLQLKPDVLKYPQNSPGRSLSGEKKIKCCRQKQGKSFAKDSNPANWKSSKEAGTSSCTNCIRRLMTY